MAVVSIKKLSSSCRYHVRQAQREYYAEDRPGERPGQWIGRGAALLGLKGIVTEKAFGRILEGFHPVTKEKLVKNAGHKRREGGQDVVISLDKPTSVLFATGSPEVRAAILSGFEAVVREVVVPGIEAATFTRVGKSGKYQRAVPVISCFIHLVSRNNDPQLHIHLLPGNVGVYTDESGQQRTGAIVSKPLYQKKMALGALATCEMAEQLKTRLPGIPLDGSGHPMGIPDNVLNHFSSRSAEIAAELEGSKGSSKATAKEKEKAAVRTRRGKDLSRPFAELRSKWLRECHALGFDPVAYEKSWHRPLEVSDRTSQSHLTDITEAANVPSKTSTTAKDEKTLESEKPRPADRTTQVAALRPALRDAVKEVSRTKLAVTKSELLAETAKRVVGKVGAKPVTKYVGQAFKRRGPFKRTGRKGGQPQFSTRTMQARAKAVKELAKELSRNEASHRVSTPKVLLRSNVFNARAVRRWIAREKDPHLSSGQRNAVNRTTENSGQLAVIHTNRGQDTTSVVEGLASHYSLQYDCQVVTRTRRQRDRLKLPKDVKGRTVRSICSRLGWDYSVKAAGVHAAKNIVREGAGRYIGLYPWRRKPLLKKKSVVIVQDAHWLGVRDMETLLKSAKKSGAKLVLVGSSETLEQDKAYPFSHIKPCVRHSHYADAPLKTRCKIREKEASVHEQSDGESDARLKAAKNLVADWVASGGGFRPKSHVITARSKKDCSLLNALAGEALINGERVILRSGEELANGFRIVWNRDDKRKNIRAGTFGTVRGVSELLNLVQVEMDTGQLVSFRAKNLPVSLAFAMTPAKLPQHFSEASFLSYGGTETAYDIPELLEADAAVHVFSTALAEPSFSRSYQKRETGARHSQEHAQQH